MWLQQRDSKRFIRTVNMHSEEATIGTLLAVKPMSQIKKKKKSKEKKQRHRLYHKHNQGPSTRLTHTHTDQIKKINQMHLNKSIKQNNNKLCSRFKRTTIN